MKAVLMSVHPEWCEKITHIIAQNNTKLFYEKSVEIRKTRPKLDTPFKVYIYCTKSRKPYESFAVSGKPFECGGKVIGEFVCDEIFPIRVFENGTIQDYMWHRMYLSCVPYDDISKYIGKDKTGYGWHISDLVIYDKPKELIEFRSYNPTVKFEAGYPTPIHEITRPPQSWCYVEGAETNG